MSFFSHLSNAIVTGCCYPLNTFSAILALMMEPYNYMHGAL